VTVNYTLPRSLNGPPRFDMPLMETPYEDVLVALVLDTKLNVRFVRTGSRAEGARVALVNVASLLDERRHWRITLAWDPDELSVSVEPYS
jgi:hypothetical protein